MNGIRRHISEIIIDFDFARVKRNRQERYIANEIYESNLELDLNQFDDGNSMSHEHNRRTGNLLTSMIANNGGIMTARTRIFEERYSGGVLDINIFCFAIISDNSGGSTIAKQTSNMSKNHMIASNHQQEIKEEVEEESSVAEGFNERSQSATGSSSSINDSTASMSEFRNFHSFSQ